MKLNWNDYFTYDPEEGVLRWKVSTGKRSKVGQIAGSLNARGYVQIRVKGVSALAHRVIWEMLHGSIDESLCIDHINHIRDDNRLVNLRLITPQENDKNKPKFKRNKSGQTGVSYHKRDRRWIACIGVEGKLVHLGYFDSFDKAVFARKEAERFYGYHPNNGL